MRGVHVLRYYLCFSDTMAETETATSTLAFNQSESKNGKLDLNKIASQLAQFMEVDTAKDVRQF